MQSVRVLLFIGTTLLATPSFVMAADDGAKTFAEVCSECHTPKRQPLDKVQLTRAQWNETLERMKGYGAEIPKAKLPELIDYLVATHGPGASAPEPQKK